MNKADDASIDPVRSISIPTINTHLKCRPQKPAYEAKDFFDKTFSRFSRLKREIVTLDELEAQEGHFFDKKEPEWAKLTPLDYDEQFIHQYLDDDESFVEKEPENMASVVEMTEPKVMGENTNEENFEEIPENFIADVLQVQEPLHELWCESVHLMHLTKVDFHQVVISVQARLENVYSRKNVLVRIFLNLRYKFRV